MTGESAVTLSVTLPDGIQSRAFGDGTTAQKLTMLVLDGETALPVFTGAVPTVLSTDINLTKQVTLRLAAGKTYKREFGIREWIEKDESAAKNSCRFFW